MSKITYLENLYKKSVNLLTSGEDEWKDLLSTVGRFYKRSFDNAVLIHVQAPDSTQLATFDEWHGDGINRSINKGVKGLAVIDMNNPQASFKYYFDLLDTNGSSESFRKVVSYMWELENQYKPSLMIKFHDKYSTTTESIEDSIFEIVQKTVLTNYGSYIDNFEVKDESSVLYDVPKDVVRQELLELVVRSAYYVVMSRCGMKTDDVSFENISHFNSLPLFVNIGSMITNVARPILREIDQEIKVIKSERSKIYEHQSQTQRTSDTSDLHRGQGRTSLSRPRNLSERADRGSGQVREDVERLDDREPPRQSDRTRDDGANQSSDSQSGQRSRGTQGAVNSEPTEITADATDRGHTHARVPHEDDLPHSRGTYNQRGTVPSAIITENEKPSVVSDKKLATDGFFVVPKSKQELATEINVVPTIPPIEDFIFPSIGTFFDYLNGIYMYVGTDADDNDRHIIRSLEEKDVAFSYTDEGFYHFLTSKESEVVTDPALNNVFGFSANDEVYIWSTKYKITDFDCDEVVFQSVNNSDDVRTETLLDTLEYLKHSRNHIEEVEEENVATNSSLIGTVVKIEDEEYTIEKIDFDDIDVDPVVYLHHVEDDTKRIYVYLEYVELFLEQQSRDTSFDLDEEEISDLIDDFILASDIEENTLDFQSEIYNFFSEPNHKMSSKVNVIKAFYGNLNTSYVTKHGDYLEVVRANAHGVYIKRGGQPFILDFEDMAQRIDRLILNMEYPFSQNADLQIDDYVIPDEIDEMNGVDDVYDEVVADDIEIEEPKGDAMWQTYKEAKKQYPNDVIFYQVGDFFEVFERDAYILADDLGFTLTKRDMGLDEKVPMCGIPKTTLNQQIERLHELGYDVSALEQYGDKHELVRSEREFISIAKIDQADIDNAILDWNGDFDSKTRVIEHIRFNIHGTELSEWLKNEYGQNQPTFRVQVGDVSNEIPWEQVASRITKLIAENRFFVNDETKRYTVEFTSDAFEEPFGVRDNTVSDYTSDRYLNDDGYQLFMEEEEAQAVADRLNGEIKPLVLEDEVANEQEDNSISLFNSAPIEQLELFSLSPEPYEDNDTEGNDGIITGTEQEVIYPFPIGTKIYYDNDVYEILDYLYDGFTVELIRVIDSESTVEFNPKLRTPTDVIKDCDVYRDENQIPQVEINHFYEDSMLYKVSFVFDGKEYSSGVTQQGEKHYVRVGSAVGGDLQHINLTAEQVTAFYEFVDNENAHTVIREAPALSENQNYRYSPEHNLYEGGAKTKCRANIAAIKLLKQLESENRLATPEEQITLAGYVGWGGLANALTPNKDGWLNEYAEITSLLTEEELLSAQESTITAYYTEQMIIENIYKALNRFGFESGNILDPAMGTGNFYSVLPDSMAQSKLYGVELDSITGGIAKQLYPNADIQIKGFEHTNFSDQFFDVAIGNIPFNNISISDKKYNKYNFKIHDYFIAKSLDKVRPGGIVAFITSKGTMDKSNPNVRKYIAQRAKLMGAIRLPNNAFKQVAGTEVTSDILFFQKRETEIVPSQENSPWMTIEENEDGIPVNSYFIDHPEMILGKMVFDRSMYGDEKATACHPIDGDDLADRLDSAVHYLDGEYITPTSEFEEEKENTGVSIDADSTVKNFSYTIHDDKVWYRENSRMYLQEIGGKKEERIRGQIYIHKALRDLIDYQTDDYVREHADAEVYRENIEKKIAYLNHCYDEFVSKNGFLNLPVNISAFKRDSGAPLLRSAEKAHPDNDKVFEKADMFYRPTIQRREAPKIADNAHDALKICLNERGKVDLLYIYERYANANGERVPPDEIIKELGDLIYQDPDLMGKDSDMHGWVLREEYLSGYVKDKLSKAQEMAEDYPDRFSRNVEALQEVQPEPLLSHDIEFTLGSTWIPKEIYEQFIYEICQTERSDQSERGVSLEYSEYANRWHITNKSYGNNSVVTNQTYGTSRKNAYEIIEDSLNLGKVEVRDREEYIDPKTGEEKVRYPLNRNETVLARSKQDEIIFKFKDWLFKDPVRSTQMEDLYNDTFNNIVLRQYNGDDLTFPDMAENIHLRKHQRDVVAQGIYSGRNVLMAHEVGSGKTYSSIALAYELKRIGIVNKPLIAVPNHLVRQWASAYMEVYPNANILVAEKKDFEKQNRKRFASRIAVSDFDAVIMAHSSFEKINLSPEYRVAALKDELSEITNAIADLKRAQNRDWGIKQMHIFKKQLQTRYDKLFNESKKDDSINFEELGVDCLTVDESHIYKNNFSYTKLNRIAGIGSKSSQRAMDMHMKVQYINAINDGRGVAYLTGTPISNSMSELYVIQKSLQPEDLKKAKLLMFDNWASTFGLITSSMEIKPEGGGYQIKNRFSTFHNIPELMTMFRMIADIKIAEQLPEIPVPLLATGQIQVIKTKAAPTQKEWITKLADIAEKIRLGEIKKDEFNFLQLTMMARLLAVDPRILDSDAPNDPEYKLNICASKVSEIYHETADKKLTQMIFCDQGTPKDDAKLAEMRRKKGAELDPHEKFDFYNATKQELMRQGVKESEIAFIHDYGTDLQKEQLYEKVNRGDIRVLIGSTAKCGTGMNIQKKLIALHHLDIPWRPSDLIQRNGRIIRQGNDNPEVSVFNYITEDTFDAYLYQILEQKQRYIMQIMKGDRTIRKCEDMDETVLQYAEFKAMAISDPRIRIKMEVDNEISRLTILKSAYQSSLGSLKRDISNHYPQAIENTSRLIEKSEVDVQTYKDKKPVEFEMVIDGKVYDERAKAAEHLGVLLRKLSMETGATKEIGMYAGFKISLMRGLGFSASVVIEGKRQYSVEIGDSALGAITRMENEVDKIPATKRVSENELAYLKNQLENAKKEVDKPFPDEQRLLDLLKQKTELDLGLEFKQDGDSDLCFDDDEEEESENLEDGGFITEDYKQLTTEQKLFRKLEPMLSEFLHGDRYYAKYKSDAFMDLVIENIGHDEFSIAHYYEQNGDMMRDPEITFIVDTEKSELHPTSFLQDGMGIYYHTDAASKAQIADLKSFMGTWFNNINHQGFELFKEKSFEQDDERW